MRPRLFAVLFCFFMSAANATSPQEFTGREYAEAMLLLSPSDYNIRLAAKSIRHFNDGRQNILDLLAEVTWTACAGKRKIDPDTLSWFAKYLASTKQARYAALLDYCLASVTDVKTLKHLKQARESLEGTATSSFEGGKMDLEVLRANLAKKGKTTPRPELAKQFNELRNGQRLEDIYTAFGTPNEVSAVNVKGKKVGFGVTVQLTDDMIVFGYNTLGTIRFVYNTPKDDWLLADAQDDNGLFWNRSAGRFGTFSELITNGDETDLREVLKRLSRQKDIDRTTLDQIAERIYRSRGNKSDEMADVLARLCHIIGNSRDGRYKQVLLDVSDTAEDRTLRKHAGKAAKNLRETTEEKFVPAPG
jgi:hypothetical protein